MKRIGNSESNKTYNPRNTKPQIPIDIDEVDSAMERYIRQKYEQRIYMHDTRPGTRQNTGSTSSDDRPPPLPPKPTGRFGFGLRKAATSPRDLTPPVSPGLGGFNHEASPPHVNKASRVFGSNVQQSGDGLESKLATLRDMGFPDDKRNSTVLKGFNGNLDRTVEALIRLGEQNPVRSRGSTPTPPTKPSVTGLSFDRSNTAPVSSTNPFDALDAVAAPLQQPQQTQQQSYEAPSNSYNPFLQQAQYQQQQQQQSIPQQQQQQQQQQNYNYRCSTCSLPTHSRSNRCSRTAQEAMGQLRLRLRKLILFNNRSHLLQCHRYPNSIVPFSHRSLNISPCLRLRVRGTPSSNLPRVRCSHQQTLPTPIRSANNSVNKLHSRQRRILTWRNKLRRPPPRRPIPGRPSNQASSSSSRTRISLFINSSRTSSSLVSNSRANNKTKRYKTSNSRASSSRISNRPVSSSSSHKRQAPTLMINTPYSHYTTTHN
jgi:hypothetical protein